MSIKSKGLVFKNTKFGQKTLQDAVQHLKSRSPNLAEAEWRITARIRAGKLTTKFTNNTDGFSSFLSAISEDVDLYDFWIQGPEANFSIIYNKLAGEIETDIMVEAPDISTINETVQFFEESAPNCVQHSTDLVAAEKPLVFIGHGRSAAWRELKDHLTDKHDIKVVAYETGSRAGHTIRDVLEDMSLVSNIAFLVLTAEDEMDDGTAQARPNVIHETGLFQGKLGFSRAIVLLEEGCEEFSNLAGIQQLRFRKNNIREVFGDAIATIRREFPDSR